MTAPASASLSTPYRIGILTSGGDCPGLNAVIRGTVCAAETRGWEVLGFSDGYEGLLSPVRYRPLTVDNTHGITALGGTILGTTNKGRFVAKVGLGDKALIPKEIISEARETIEGLGISALVCLGGDGSLTTAEQLFENGIPTIGVPKTIDNDISATAMTFGFDSAVECVTEALDRLHTTARSHKRVMILEVMGRHAGWIALHGGIAGGADMILIPEIPFSYEKICREIVHRVGNGHETTMIVVAEGAMPKEGTVSAKGGHKGEVRLGGIGQQVCDEIERRTGRETRTMVLGHLQRGGAPTTLDRILGTRFGVGAVKLIEEKKFGHMVSYINDQIGSVSIPEAVGQLKTVPPGGQMVDAARSIGITFGD
ncbi:6-phosphofructokinase 1 [Verrucomicrobium sp. GAS474]|uniref:6-phosphofructokinase n=1 Tax=Verrucomicrobium sp. GAS474 TaxID=1882831 RepID=UPI00087AD660|nr:ATP-dependent 6-phosphofructokinase [Verrucomicrobium sp. GAS474]SDU20285.1 6-phosphofructokinase 1 [Verrucomicrobium sp. GAS474]